jgi:hypothetical protein
LGRRLPVAPKDRTKRSTTNSALDFWQRQISLTFDQA